MKRHIKRDALLRKQQRLLKHFRRHDRACDREILLRADERLLNAGAQVAILADDIQKLLHQLVALVLEQLMPAPRGGQARF